MAKPSAFIVQLEEKLRAEYTRVLEAMEADHKQRLSLFSEVCLMALLISAHEELKVGPGRAGFLTAEYLDTKTKIADELVKDIGHPDKYNKGEWVGDKEFLTTRKNLAQSLKAIYGPENWEKYKELFPMLKEFW